ncbi:unnamed protein product [Paramecium pentaurelia]|uniref:Transmembrane protein n=1 Tax=Paramecium pentaurelia TaxID=43138 RepID=A0A8S1YMH5_9CILI|nr:unnamed protein product [Paramecium pentaurelia]
MNSLTIIEAIVSATFVALAVASSEALLTHQKIFNNEFTMTLSKVEERMFIPAMVFTNFLKNPYSNYNDNIFLYHIWIFDRSCYQQILYQKQKIYTPAQSYQLLIPILQIYNYKQLMVQQHQSEKETESKLVTIIIIQTVIVNAFRWSIGKRILQQHKVTEQQSDVELLTLKIAQQQQQLQSNQNKKQESSF